MSSVKPVYRIFSTLQAPSAAPVAPASAVGNAPAAVSVGEAPDRKSLKNKETLRTASLGLVRLGSCYQW